MIKFYKYYFYCIYQWQLNWWGKKWNPEITASWGTAFVVNMNMYFIAGVVWLMFFRELFPLLRSKTIVVLTLIGAELLISHFFCKKNRLSQIEKLFKDNHNSVIFDSVFFIVYNMVTILSLFSFLLIPPSKILADLINAVK